LGWWVSRRESGTEWAVGGWNQPDGGAADELTNS